MIRRVATKPPVIYYSMKCDNQSSIKLDKPKPDNRGGLIYNIPINCGKCLNCKKNRVNQWSFRLMKELEVSTSSYFITLTYDTVNIPITNNGFMTLKKKPEPVKQRNKDYKDQSLQGFIKRLRYYEGNLNHVTRIEYEQTKKSGIDITKQKPLKYYAAGEYGTKRKRPHYHIILFNLKDEESIYKAWTSGSVHIDEVNNNTIDYTLKYIMKANGGYKFKAFDGEKEFSLMSKGLGDSYLTKKQISFYKKNLEHNYVFHPKGYKVPTPKYYRDKIYSDNEKDKQIAIIKQKIDEKESKFEAVCDIYGFNPEQIKQKGKEARAILLQKVTSRPID